MTLMRMPMFGWTPLVTSVLLLFAIPVVTAGPDDALHRPQLRRRLLRPGARRQPDPVAARLLVLRPPRGLHPHPAGVRRRQRDPAGLHPQAALRLQGLRLRDGRHRRCSASPSGRTTCSRRAPSTCRSSASSPFLIAVPTGIKFFNWLATMWRRQAQLRHADALRARLHRAVPDRRARRRLPRRRALRLPRPGHVLGRLAPALRALRRVGVRRSSRRSSTGSRR